jgi:regulatory associated protein of mTOR
MCHTQYYSLFQLVLFFLADLFQKLFRQDLLVASLFRNFLLAERIMRSYDCVPVSSPSLPPTYQVKNLLLKLKLENNLDLLQHPMWQAWDLALDLCLGQLPDILNTELPFEHSNFFEEQLTAFEVWLELGSSSRSPPEQLPVVLQVRAESELHEIID